MSVYEYNEGEHNGGFIGLRVAVMVGGKHLQKYYSYVKKPGSRNRAVTLKSESEIGLLMTDAKKLNRQWLKDKREQQKIRHTFGPPLGSCINSQWDTGIRGLTCRYKVRDFGAVHKTLILCISVYATHDNGEKLQRSCHVEDERTIETVWRRLGKVLALSRGLKRMPYKWINALPGEQDRKKMYRNASKQYLIA